MTEKTALLVIDIQNDFTHPSGSLSVPGARENALPYVNSIMSDNETFDMVIATKDWHPPEHGSFASNHEGAEIGDVQELDGLDQIMWPDHCVQDTWGSQLDDDLLIELIDHVFYKGRDPTVDSYSGFYDNGHRNSTGLAEFLRKEDVDTVYVAGVATDYCVKYTVLDALSEGFETYLVTDACAGVNMNEGDVDEALQEMKEAGATILKGEFT